MRTVLICMMPRALSRESATCVGTTGRVRTADMLDCKKIVLAMQNMHVIWCRAALAVGAGARHTCLKWCGSRRELWVERLVSVRVMDSEPTVNRI